MAWIMIKVLHNFIQALKFLRISEWNVPKETWIANCSWMKGSVTWTITVEPIRIIWRRRFKQKKRRENEKKMVNASEFECILCVFSLVLDFVSGRCCMWMICIATGGIQQTICFCCLVRAFDVCFWVQFGWLGLYVCVCSVSYLYVPFLVVFA